MRSTRGAGLIHDPYPLLAAALKKRSCEHHVNPALLYINPTNVKLKMLNSPERSTTHSVGGWTPSPGKTFDLSERDGADDVDRRSITEFSAKFIESLWRQLQLQDQRVKFGRFDRLRDRYELVKPFEFNMWANDRLGVPYFNGSSFKLTKTLKVVAMQAPLPNTLDDFVKLAIADKITHIVTLGQAQDYGVTKMTPYWQEGYMSLSGIRIVYVANSCRESPGAKTRTLVFQLGDALQRINHIHFYAWPDASVPDRRQFNNIVRIVLNEVRAERCKDLVVHCSAGIGRTGTFLAALKMRLEGLTDFTPTDVFETVMFLKKQRALSVPNKEQFDFLIRESYARD